LGHTEFDLGFTSRSTFCAASSSKYLYLSDLKSDLKSVLNGENNGENNIININIEECGCDRGIDVEKCVRGLQDCNDVENEVRCDKFNNAKAGKLSLNFFLHFFVQL
jgi:hypothetical protein